MKRTLIFIITAGFILNATAQSIRALEQEQKREARQKLERLAMHPFRVVDGVTNGIRAKGWCTFHGEVVGVHPDGIRVRGFYTPLDDPKWRSGAREFFVSNFPFETAEGDHIPMRSWYVAKLAGTYRYTTVLGGPRTLHKLDYGKPVAYTPPPARALAAKPPPK